MDQAGKGVTPKHFQDKGLGMPSGNGNGRIHNGGNGRLSNGKFAPGNPGGPGRPKEDKLRELREKVRNCITPDQLTKLMGVMYREAMSGETPLKDRVPCARMVLEYTVGKPDAIDAALAVTSSGEALQISIVRPGGGDDDA